MHPKSCSSDFLEPVGLDTLIYFAPSLLPSPFVVKCKSLWLTRGKPNKTKRQNVEQRKVLLKGQERRKMAHVQKTPNPWWFFWESPYRQNLKMRRGHGFPSDGLVVRWQGSVPGISCSAEVAILHREEAADQRYCSGPSIEQEAGPCPMAALSFLSAVSHFPD